MSVEEIAVLAWLVCSFLVVCLSMLSKGETKMTVIRKNKLTVTLSEYVIRCTQQERTGEFTELMKTVEWLTTCDLKIAECIARETLGIPRLHRNMHVSYTLLSTSTFTVPTRVIAESDYAVIS